MSPLDVDGRSIPVTNLTKVLFPGTGMTKADIIAYYVAVSPVLLPQLADRPLTRIRWPHGTDGASFFEKNIPAGTPSWVRRVVLDAPGSSRATIHYPLVDDTAGLVWLANLAALELHTPQWRVRDGSPLPPDRLVVDLDPGPRAGLHECALVALHVRLALAARGLTHVVPVTSGSKGMQLYARLDGTKTADEVREDAKELAEKLAAAQPELVVSSMTKSVRPGKVFLDWSQNTASKTTITPYSLRGKRASPYVAAPRSWAEVEEGAAGEDFTQMTPAEVLARLESDDGRVDW